MLELAGGNNGWLGGLADLAIWNCALSGTDSTGTTDNYTPTWNKAAGESAALYNTPTSGISALSHYGALAMNQLFTVYAQQNPSAATAVATADGTLDWHYVAGGLPGASGGVGQVATGVYYVQLDSAGGGVETCLPGDANLDGTVDINDLTIVLAHYNQTGMGWTQGEFTGDGTVDINDLTIVLAHYNQSVGAASLAAVPEPSSVALLAAVALSAAWVIARQRREV